MTKYLFLCVVWALLFQSSSSYWQYENLRLVHCQELLQFEAFEAWNFWLAIENTDRLRSNRECLLSSSVSQQVYLTTSSLSLRVCLLPSDEIANPVEKKLLKLVKMSKVVENELLQASFTNVNTAEMQIETELQFRSLAIALLTEDYYLRVPWFFYWKLFGRPSSK